MVSYLNKKDENFRCALTEVIKILNQIALNNITVSLSKIAALLIS